MRILLVEPPLSPFDVPTGLVGLPEPLALETVAAKICENHDVTILDMRIENALDEYLGKINPQVVGVGAVTANLHLAKNILKKSKLFNPKILTIIGGHHVTFLPEDANENFIDIIVRGEGDFNTAEIVNALDKNISFDHIHGLIINKNGLQFSTKSSELISMDFLPRPARHLVARYREQYFQRNYRPIVSINTSRGCPYKCDFCSLWKMNKGKYRTRSAELVFDELKTFKESFIDFIDDNTIENTSRIKKIAELLLVNNINKKMKMYARADTIVKNRELIKLLAKAGLEMLLVGFESINDNELKMMNKKYHSRINDQAIKILQNENIRIISYFLIQPDFDEQDFQLLSNYVEVNKLVDPIYTILVPFPGTNLYNNSKEKIYYKDYRLYDFYHAVFETKLPLDIFYDNFALLYKNAYSPEKIVRGLNESGEKINNHINNFNKIYERILKLKEHHLSAFTAK